MSISFRLRPATLFVAGALLVPCAAFAQDAAPSIVPADSPTAPVPAPVASPATAPTTTQPIIGSMTFNDVEVTELLSMISTQFDLPIAISGDVSGKLRSINLKEKTAEQALNAVIQAAQLSCQKTEDGTYIISKAPTAPIQAATVVPSNLPPIGPATGFGGNTATNSNGALSPFGSSAGPDTANFSVQEEPALVATGNGTDSKERTITIPIRYVKSSLMAYWLDPANHEMPADIRLSKELESRYGNRRILAESIGTGGGQFPTAGGVVAQPFAGAPQPFNTQGVVPSPNTGNPYLNSNAETVQTLSNAQFGGRGGGGFGGNNGGFGGNNNGGFGGGNNRNGAGGRNGGGTFQLPEGVSRIVAVDPQNALLVFGTPEGAARLASTIRFLDRPLRQVEIEAQFLSISTTDARSYGFDFSASRGNFNAASTGTASTTPAGGLRLGFLRGNFDAQIAASIASGKAKVLTAPRVTAINNLTASLQQQTLTPITLNQTNTVSNNGIAQQTNQNVFYVQTIIGLSVTPTINNDDTITVLMQPQLDTTGTPSSSTGAAPITSQQLQTIANVRDGETIALGGLRATNITIDKTKVPLIGDIPLIGHLFRSRNQSAVESELIIFLTARIIRRVGDDDAVGTTDIPVGIG